MLYRGEQSSSQDAFTCPHCGCYGFRSAELVQHVTWVLRIRMSWYFIDIFNRSHHAGETNAVICPICIVQPTGDPNQMIRDLSTHMSNEHQEALFVWVLSMSCKFQVDQLIIRLTFENWVSWSFFTIYSLLYSSQMDQIYQSRSWFDCINEVFLWSRCNFDQHWKFLSNSGNYFRKLTFFVGRFLVTRLRWLYLMNKRW